MMKGLGKFLKTTLAGGLLVLFPLFGSIYLLARLGSIFVSFLRPALGLFPGGPDFSLPYKNAAAIALLLLLCFLIGLAVMTHLGKTVGGWMERHLLSKIPGFVRYRALSQILLGSEVAGAPVLVQRGAEKQFGFLIEESSSGELTIMMPIAPGLRSGTVIIIQASLVQRLDAPPSEAARVLMQCGVGASALSRLAAVGIVTQPLAPTPRSGNGASRGKSTSVE
jgi:uncharacterized membrane protein